MNLTRRDPYEFAFAPFTPMSRLFNQFLGESDGNGLAQLEEGTLPLDISEDEKNVIVRASVPGFGKEDIDVEVHNSVLTIKAQHTDEHEEKNERFYRRERRFGSMSRRVALPSTVREDACSAELKDGVLTLLIPKSEAAMPRKVQINERAPAKPQPQSQPNNGPSPTPR